jgi:hypothetical protein
MDHRIRGPTAPIRLRRTCERNRLERQCLIHAYECLVTLATPAQQDHVSGNRVVPEEESSGAHAQAREACGVGQG